MDELTIKDLYDIIDKRFNKLELSVEKYHDAFMRFEEGKLTQALQDIKENQGKIALIQEQIKNDDNGKEKRKDWYWGAAEKIIFSIIGVILFICGLVLEHLGILNLK